MNNFQTASNEQFSNNAFVNNYSTCTIIWLLMVPLKHACYLSVKSSPDSPHPIFYACPINLLPKSLHHKALRYLCQAYLLGLMAKIICSICSYQLLSKCCIYPRCFRIRVFLFRNQVQNEKHYISFCFEVGSSSFESLMMCGRIVSNFKCNRSFSFVFRTFRQISP